jgi:hypothetical protein
VPVEQPDEERRTASRISAYEKRLWLTGRADRLYSGHRLILMRQVGQPSRQQSNCGLTLTINELTPYWRRRTCDLDGPRPRCGIDKGTGDLAAQYSDRSRRNHTRNAGIRYERFGMPLLGIGGQGTQQNCDQTKRVGQAHKKLDWVRIRI